MRFLYPNMLWGLLALLIPIIIHLFNFRRHKLVYFSNTAILRTIQQENAKTRKLKHLVTLLLRCLFISALVFAFAFPFRPEKQMNVDSAENLIGVYIDNSMSMKGQSARTTLIEDARQSARDLVHKLSPSSRYLLMTNSFEIQNEHPMNQEEMLNQLDRMNIDGAPVAMGVVMDRFGMLARQYGFSSATLFVYSDFQRNTFDLTAAHADTSINMVMVPLTPEFKTNIYIDSVWLTSPIVQPNLANDLNVRVVNQCNKDVKGLPVSFVMNGVMVASTTVDVEKNGSIETAMQFVVDHTGEQRCTVNLTDYPIIFDDTYDFVLNVKPSLSVVELGSESTSCSLVFEDDELFSYTPMEPSRLDLSRLAQAQLLIVNETSTLNETLQQTILDAATEGASLVVFPSTNDPKCNQYLYEKLGLKLMETDTNSTATEDMALQHNFFSDMVVNLPQHPDLPVVRRHVRLRTNGDVSVLMTLQNGDPLLLSRTVGKGQAFIFSTALHSEWSNLADNDLFVPTMIKAALLGSHTECLAYTLGVDRMLLLNDVNLVGDHKFQFVNDDQTFVSIPASVIRNGKVYLYMDDNLPVSGFYNLSDNDSVVRVTAWNESRIESKMDFVDRDEVSKAFDKAGLRVSAMLDTSDFVTNDWVEAMACQSSLWKYFVLVALFALLGEIAVLRFWK